MKEKPDLEEKRIIDHLQEAYGLGIMKVEFLPIGDISSAKYRVVTGGTYEQATYFLKIRKDGFKEISVTIPYFLHEQGIHQIIPPIKTKDGWLWTRLDGYICILYPFVEGQNGFQKPLSNRQWREFGEALKSVHSIKIPLHLQRKIPIETFSPHWRERATGFLDQAQNHSFEDPIAAHMAAALQKHREEIRFVIERAEELGKALQSQPAEISQHFHTQPGVRDRPSHGSNFESGMRESQKDLIIRIQVL
jgi:spectinomycin phosphotransferase